MPSCGLLQAVDDDDETPQSLNVSYVYGIDYDIRNHATLNQ